MSLQISRKSWWETDRYDRDWLIPPRLLEPEAADFWGPKGPALVRAYPDGSTQQGWGLTGKEGSEGFMPRYLRGEFLPRRTEYGYEHGKHAAALVMRSARLMCVDIDGKNGGLEHARSLGALPHTLAETSKSGNGYHLYYATDEEWDEKEGFGLIPDHIGIVQGVDIRGVGCVYHQPTQRWNNHMPAPLPEWLRDRLLLKKQQRQSAAVNIHKKLTTLDETEILIMHSELIDELAKPVPAGRRNNTLFAIGSKLKLAEVPDWEEKVRDRAEELGLDINEAEKLINNISNYGG
jgi:hypothetical protein